VSAESGLAPAGETGVQGPVIDGPPPPVPSAVIARDQAGRATVRAVRVMEPVRIDGVVSYAVAQRTREVGIRMALGADSRTMVWLLAASGLKLVAVGGAIGLTVAFVVTRLLSGLLFDIDTIDPLTFIGMPLVLGATALLAPYLPARRASRINPVAALRL